MRFYTFPAIRGYFIKFLTKLSYYTRNTHLPFAKQKLLRLATQPRMFESAGGNQKATSGRTGFSLLAPFDFMFLCHPTSFCSSTSSCFRAKRIIASTYPCRWPFPPAEPAESTSIMPQSSFQDWSGYKNSVALICAAAASKSVRAIGSRMSGDTCESTNLDHPTFRVIKSI